ncbi:hypothetical protein LTR84_009112 [Exophiala bonariae]|uniref:Glucose-methanol-choline oxidoreductase N-terminal domain-containing protein n=1 Tax=Exophiala bonariae TaxID=1690606 RepID=A0AAV9MVX3_9EURO|nr:hypothetical protein LTR84_009112 [Exophiala bonariae]
MHSKNYTHIVVGAGSAGCVVAARIAERQDTNVLLLEAGPDYDNMTDESLLGVQDARKVPMKGQSEVFDLALDWNIDVTLPRGESMQVPQGKVVGGGSSINGGTALRNTVADAQEWVELGNNHWDFDSLYQVYQRLEDDRYRGTTGPHPIVRTSLAKAGNIQRAFVESAMMVGIPAVHDLNATGAEGVGPSPVCCSGHRRVSAANTFIDPIRNRHNFTILPNSQVDKILFSEIKAYAVLLGNGDVVHASSEVILCAGAVFSPAILQRSGIGSPLLLENHAIQLISNLPVGENLSDHPCIPVVARPKPLAYQDGDHSLQMQARWSSSQRPGAVDLQLVCFSYLFVPPSTAYGARGLAGTMTGHVVGIGCNVNKPTSTGLVTIRSTNVSDYPTVDPNYLHTDHDRKAAREVVRRAYCVMTTSAMQKVLEEPLALNESIVVDDAALDEWILSQLSSTYHFCGSCKMAARDQGGVVDQSGRVYGVQGLRVADASIIPTVPASNTMLTTMMFAERIGCSVRDAVDVGTEDRGSSRL